MTTYVDSSVLVAIYLQEQFSAAARRAIKAVRQVPFTQVHRLEVMNAFELTVGRGVMSRHECRLVQGQLQEDLVTHRLVRVALDLDLAFNNASELARVHTVRVLSRSMDLVHVAAAHLMGCSTFISADDRQLAIAKATGLKVIDIKPRRP